MFTPFFCNQYLFRIHNNSIKPLECQEALGMESGAISDGQISASSEFDASHAAGHGRLHFQETHASWSARKNDVNQWLQIDLISYYITVTRVATQGRYSALYNQWVTEYKLQYSINEVSFKYYREEGQNADKVRKIKSIKTKGWKGFSYNSAVSATSVLRVISINLPKCYLNFV